MPVRLLSAGSASGAEKVTGTTATAPKKDSVAKTGKPAKKEEPKQKSKVYLLHSDILKKTLDRSDAQVVVGNVIFRHDSLYMYCDSAYYFDQRNSFEAFGNVRMEQGDTLFLYGDHLYYDGMTQIAQMRMNVRLETGTQRC